MEEKHADAATPQTESNGRQLSTAWRRRLLLIGAAVGWICALCVVVVWLPHSVWSNPIALDDAAGHYYMARKLFDQGPASLMKLSTDNSFYPPLFSALTVIWMKLGASVVAATIVTWLIGAAIVFPISMTGLAAWLFRDQTWQTRLVAVVAAPVMASLIPAHPYAQLVTGPLLPYGLALSMVPAALLTFLIILNRLSRVLGGAKLTILVAPVLAFVILALLEAVTQPRIVFTFLVLALPFCVHWLVELRNAHRRCVIALTATLIGLAVVAVTVVTCHAAVMHPTKTIFEPSAWFSSYHPTHGVIGGLACALTGALAGYGESGLTTAAIVALALITCAVVSWRKPSQRPLIVAWVFAATLSFICASLPGPIGNVLTAPWYREEHRIIGTVAIPVVLLMTCGIAEIARVGVLRRRVLINAAVAIVLIASLLINPQRSNMATYLRDATTPSAASPNSMLTQYKLDAFAAISLVVGPNGLVFADPYTGFGYAYGLNNIHAYYSVGNLWPTAERKMVNNDFHSGDAAQMTGALCSVMPQYDNRFVADFGVPYRDNYDSFEYYAAFRDEAVIAKYVETGALTLVDTYASGQNTPFKLYEVVCEPRDQ